MVYIKNLEVTIGGVKNPKIDVRGCLLKNAKILIEADGKEVEYTQDVLINHDYILNKICDNKYDLNICYSALLKRNVKKVDLFVLYNGKKIIIKTLKSSLIQRLIKRGLFGILKIFNIIKKIMIELKKNNFKLTIKLIKSKAHNISTNLKQNTIISSAFYNPLKASDYNKWLQSNKNENSIIELNYNPKISIFISTENFEMNKFLATINSIKNQNYNNYDIYVLDYGYNNLDDVVNRYEGIHLMKCGEQKKFKFLNNAIKMSDADYVYFLNNYEILEKNALYEIAKSLNEKKYDLIYSDEDSFFKNIYCNPFFKPDFSLDTLYSINYLNYLTVYKKTAIEKIGGFNDFYSLFYDLTLRFAEYTNNIKHIDSILCHTVFSNSLDINEREFDGYEKVINESLKRRKLNGNIIKNKEKKYYYVNYLLNEEPSISIIIPTRDRSEILKRCLVSIYEKTNYKNYEVVVVDNGSVEQQTMDLFEEYKEKYNNFKVLRLDCEFNYSYLNNEAVKKSESQYIMLLNNDTEVLYGDWLKDMVGYASLSHVGCVGAKLLYPNDTIQHAGVLLSYGGVAGHVYIGYDPNEFGYYGRLVCPYNYSAVTAACLLVKKSIYEEVGMLDEKLRVAYNDVDFNLKVLKCGYYNVVLPNVILHHYESISRGNDLDIKNKERFLSEVDYMCKKWGKTLEKDKFYNKNLSYNYSFYLDRKKK